MSHDRPHRTIPYASSTTGAVSIDRAGESQQLGYWTVFGLVGSIYVIPAFAAFNSPSGYARAALVGHVIWMLAIWAGTHRWRVQRLLVAIWLCVVSLVPVLRFSDLILDELSPYFQFMASIRSVPAASGLSFWGLVLIPLLGLWASLFVPGIWLQNPDDRPTPAGLGTKIVLVVLFFVVPFIGLWLHYLGEALGGMAH